MLAVVERTMLRHAAFLTMWLKWPDLLWEIWYCSLIMNM